MLLSHNLDICCSSGQLEELIHEQDLGFSVKLQFGKTLGLVQNKFSLQTFLFKIFWTKNKYLSQEKFHFQIFWVQKFNVLKIVR